MVRCRDAVASLLVFMFGLDIATTQEVAHENPRKDLELVAIGNGNLRNGHATAVRVYAAPDGSKGQVVYTKLDSVRAAQRLIREWQKNTTITSRQKNQTKGGQLIGDHILALADLTKSVGKEFVIIRRDGLNCYLIESTSCAGRECRLKI
jgi:hypothetical protein